MVLKYFWPEKSFTMDDLDKISDKVHGKWTWPTAAMLWMIDHDFEIKLIEDFDYHEFARRGGKYIIDKCGPEVGESQIKNSDIESEKKYATRFAELNLVERRLPTFEDIKRLLSDGYLLICNINASALNQNPGYSGHFVVLYECDDQSVTLHDPGLPPQPTLKVPHDLFLKAWAYPSANEKNLMAIRPKKP